MVAPWKSSETLNRRQRLALGTILIAAMGTRLALFLVVYPQNRQCVLLEDSLGYERPALAMLRYGRFLSEPHPDARPEFHRTPGYPAFLAAVYAVFGEERAAAIVIQILLSVFIPLLGFQLGRAIHSPGAGLVAAVLLAIDPVQVFLSEVMLTDAMASLLCGLAAVLGVALIRNHGRAWTALALGLVLAVATLTRPIAYYLAPGVAVGIIVFHRRLELALFQSFRTALCCILPSAVLVGGWQVRNALTVGTIQVSGIAAYNMLHYRAAGVYALRNHVPLNVAAQTLEDRMLRETDSAQNLHDRRLAYGKKILLHDPAGTLRLTGVGVFRMMADPGAALLFRFLGIRPTTNQSLTQKMTVSPLDYLRKWWGTSPVAGVVFAWALVVLGTLYLLLAIGVFARFRGCRCKGMVHLYLAGIVLYFVLISAGAESDARFRAMFVPILAAYAGYGCSRLWQRRLCGAPPKREKPEPAG